jgi:thioredoxin-related protein
MIKKYLSGVTLVFLIGGCLDANDMNSTKDMNRSDTLKQEIQDNNVSHAKLATSIQWEKNVAVAIAKGKRLHKPVMVLVNRDGCGWCDRFKADTLRDPKVIEILNKNYISVEGYTNRGTIPDDLVTRGTPGTWFIKNGEPMFQALMGAIPVAQYLEALDIVSKEFKKTPESAKK